MNELLAFLREKNFNLAPICDGSWEKCDRDGDQNGRVRVTQIQFNGSTVLIATLWDWKTGEIYHFRTKGKYTSEQDAELDERIKKHEQERREEEERLWAETAAWSESAWPNFPDRGSSPYLTRKGVGGSLYGCKLSPVTGDVLTVVPARDITGKLWGLQYIPTPAGSKKNFKKHTRKQGCFHAIQPLRDSEDVVHICEGLATAISVYQALGGSACVISAFDAGNLLPVAKAVREKYPQAKIIFCADDDRATQAKKGDNPGVRCAQRAAKEVRGELRRPRFAEGTEGSDFNDVHMAEGLDAVRAALNEEAGDEFIIPLGYAGDHYFFTSSSNPQINSFRDLSETECYKLMPREWWLENYGEWQTFGKGKAATSKQVIDWACVKSDLMGQCREVGFFEHRRIRGSGVWVDQGKVVVHLGDRLWYDGANHDLRSLDTEFVYEYGRKLPPISEAPLSLSDLQLFRDLTASFNYARPEQQMFLGGWMAIAGICGVLPWRPHIWVTGEQGAGKSTALDMMVKRFTAAFDQLHVQGASTEAGLRQTLRSKAIPILFDEIESHNEKAASRVEAVVELFRQASTDTGGVIVKGSSTGESTEYVARFAGCVSSIGTNLSTGADKSRFTLVELQKLGQNQAQWDRLLGLLAQVDDEYVRRFFARMVRMVPTILENQRSLQTAFARKHSQRFGQQYGTLLAGWAACISDQRLGADQVETLVNQIHLDQEISSNQTPDQEECLQHLLRKQIRLGDINTTVTELIHAQDVQKPNWEMLANRHWKDDPVWKTLKPQLAKLGLIPTFSQDRGAGVIVMASHPELRAVFRDTQWSRNWAQALGRIPGAIPNQQVRDLASRRVKGTWVPASQIVGEPDLPNPEF